MKQSTTPTTQGKDQSKRRKGVNKLVGEALTITIPRLQKQNQELAKTLKDIVFEWEKTAHRPAEFIEDLEMGVSYWSPAAIMIKAELIHNAKQVLQEAGLTDK